VPTTSFLIAVSEGPNTNSTAEYELLHHTLGKIDLCLYAGPTFTDYTTTGHAALINAAKMIQVRPDSVVLPGQTYKNVAIADFLEALAPELKKNNASLTAFRRIQEDTVPVQAESGDTPLTTRRLFARVQELLTADSTVIVETGDSWFHGMRLSLPEGARFEIQMQYGSIGWSVGVTLGHCLGRPDRRVIACIGDGSF
jgi:TPP-dependent 2-oxoacid decarboxylase